MIEPNEDQQKLLKELQKFHEDSNRRIFTYSGPPGSGKTSVIGLFFEMNNIRDYEYITCAFSGKAANVLAMKGLPAKTIHSLIYNVIMDREEKDDGTFIYKPSFVLREHLANRELKYIVVDELSMVPDNIMEDILSFGIKVIGMGDINQLPPVFGESSYMLRPDFCLTQIMRQEEGSPIIQLCQMILHNEHIDYGNYGDSRVMRTLPNDIDWINDYDMILCNRHKTRDGINSFIRKEIYKRGLDPEIGDKIMCKQNVWDRTSYGTFLTNGTIGFIDDIFEESATKNKVNIDFRADFSNYCVFQDVPMDLKFIRGSYEERKDAGMSAYIKFEYANAITVHSSQGSQYDRILYIDDGFRGDFATIKKLKYTAISRAAKRIDIVNGFNIF